jgi:hypothetical protein
MSSKARHKREDVRLVGPEGTSYWRASRYRFEASPGKDRISAVANATWERSTPFAYYRPPSKTRELDGPHLQFLRLRNIRREKPRLFKPAVEQFANLYGLLGLFQDRYSAPILPGGKWFIAPEAVIDERGRLKKLEPATEGIDALQATLWPQLAESGRELSSDVVAVPSELQFLPKRRSLPGGVDHPSGGELYPQPIPWQEAKEPYGAVFVLNERASRKATVVSTHEPADAWLFAMPDGEFLASSTNAVDTYLNLELVGVSPFGYVGEDGRREQGWRCSSLLQALHLMHHLDRYGEAAIKRCARRDCPNVYRMGSQGSDYCSDKCTSLVTTRRNRGQEP